MHMKLNVQKPTSWSLFLIGMSYGVINAGGTQDIQVVGEPSN